MDNTKDMFDRGLRDQSKRLIKDMKKITVVIEPDGTFSTDLSGFHGKGCHKVMQDFGGDSRPTLERFKTEYRETTKQEEKQHG